MEILKILAKVAMQAQNVAIFVYILIKITKFDFFFKLYIISFSLKTK